MEPIYMDDRLPYLVAHAPVSQRVADVAAEYFESKYKPASDVKNQPCFVLQRRPVVAASIKEKSLCYYVFVQNEVSVFGGEGLGCIAGAMAKANADISNRLRNSLGADEVFPEDHDFKMLFQISRMMP